MRKTPPEPVLTIRACADGKLCDVWLCLRQGAATAWLLHGELLPGTADLLASLLPGVTVEREQHPADARPLCQPAAGEADLFTDQEE